MAKVNVVTLANWVLKQRALQKALQNHSVNLLQELQNLKQVPLSNALQNLEAKALLVEISQVSHLTSLADFGLVNLD